MIAPLTLTGEFCVENARVCAMACAEAYMGAPYGIHSRLAHAKCFEFEDHRLLAWRGSYSVLDWMTDLEFLRRGIGSGVEVHHGFWDALGDAVDQLVKLGKASAKPMFVTGHSLGGAMAVLSARSLVRLGVAVPAVYTFGCPRVGNALWRRDYESAWTNGQQPIAKIQEGSGASGEMRDVSLGEVTYRVVNQEDIVCRLPTWFTGYRHVGQEIFFPSVTTPGHFVRNPCLTLRLISDCVGTWLDWKRGTIGQVADHMMGSYLGRIQF